MELGKSIKQFVTGEDPEEEKKASEEESGEADASIEECAACSKPGADKKWAGQFWHKKCYRKMRKAARGML